MLTIRRAAERGYADHGWLETHHTFSFADYQDPAQMGFRSLRVINEDRVAPGQGFGMHGHRDMEIVTLVLSGELEHRDSLGHGEILRPGELQHMSAGTGIRHSEFNPSKEIPVHLYQIWLLPRQASLTPSYGQRAFAPADRLNQWQTVASPTGKEGSLPVQTDTSILLADLAAGGEIAYELPAGRHAWLQVLRGGVTLNGQQLLTSDGGAITGERELLISAKGNAELLLFDLP